MNSAKRFTVIAIFVMALVFWGCSYIVINPEPDIKLSDSTLCQGWDAEGNPILLHEIVSPDKTEICICGYLETDQDVYLQILWAREGSSLLERLLKFREGPFLSCIRSQEGFEPGDYGVAVVAGKTTLALIEFMVGQEQ